MRLQLFAGNWAVADVKSAEDKSGLRLETIDGKLKVTNVRMDLAISGGIYDCYDLEEVDTNGDLADVIPTEEFTLEPRDSVEYDLSGHYLLRSYNTEDTIDAVNNSDLPDELVDEIENHVEDGNFPATYQVKEVNVFFSVL